MIRQVCSRVTSSAFTCFYNFTDMKVQLDQQNFLVFDPQIGGRVVELRLAGKQIIKGQHSELSNGNYLMFPWVNRIEQLPSPSLKHPYTDSNGLPIHGLYVDSHRNATVFAISEDSIRI